jgi:methionyl-tRNA formyltransferase
MHLGAELIVKTLEKIASDDIVEREQSFVEEAKHAPKLFTETCKIDWNNKVESVYNKIRGLSPYPAAFTLLNNKVLKLYRTQKINLEHHDVPSSIQTDGKTFLRFACTDGYIQVDELQLEGKKRMLTADFLRGNKID